MDQFSRTELALGTAAVAHLKTCRVAIFGVGGVGGYAAEALVRSGVGAMGAGNKLDPARLRVAYIEKTSVCPLARVMRTELKKRRIRKLKVVFSDEQPIKPDDDPALSCRNHCICPPGTVRKCTARRDIPGSTAFVPPAMGILIASEIVRDLIAAASSAQARA